MTYAVSVAPRSKVDRGELRAGVRHEIFGRAPQLGDELAELVMSWPRNCRTCLVSFHYQYLEVHRLAALIAVLFAALFFPPFLPRSHRHGIRHRQGAVG